MTPADSERARLRRRLRAFREGRSVTARMKAAMGVNDSLGQLPAFSAARDVAGYWAVGGEVPLLQVVNTIVRRGGCYWLPCIQSERRLLFAPFAPGDVIQPNRFGIPEPAPDVPRQQPQSLDVVLVPLLGFDAHGNRLGMGGGYYDTSFGFLKREPRPARPLLVGVGYAFQQVARVPACRWDVPLDLVATESGLIDCHAHRQGKV